LPSPLSAILPINRKRKKEKPCPTLSATNAGNRTREEGHGQNTKDLSCHYLKKPPIPAVMMDHFLDPDVLRKFTTLW